MAGAGGGSIKHVGAPGKRPQNRPMRQPPPCPATPPAPPPGRRAVLRRAGLGMGLALAGAAAPSRARADGMGDAAGMGSTAPTAPDLLFTMDDGEVLPARLWPAGAPGPDGGGGPGQMGGAAQAQGTVLALHGFGDSRNAWALPAPVLAAAGWQVVAPDLRGFGATASRGTQPPAARLLRDAQGLLAQLRARPGCGRLVLMGESMGGAVAMLAAARRPVLADAFIFLAPAVWGFAQMDALTRLALHLADALAPHWRPDPAAVPDGLVPTDNRDALLALARDRLSLTRPDMAQLHGLTDLMGQAAAVAGQVACPAMILSGQRDRLVPPAATAWVWDRLPAGVRRAVYPSGYHLLLRDLERAKPLLDILAWLADQQAYLPSGADAAAAAWAAAAPWQGGVPAAMPAGVLDGIGRRPAFWW